MIYSMSTAVLDLIEIILNQDGTLVYRFDGRFDQTTRNASLAAFRKGNAGRPLLITFSSGGVGLDIYEASIMIQIEAWWNLKWKRQALGRMHRQGQTREVKYRRLVAENALADSKLLSCHTRNDRVNQRLMKSLARGDREDALSERIRQDWEAFTRPSCCGGEAHKVLALV